MRSRLLPLSLLAIASMVASVSAQMSANFSPSDHVVVNTTYLISNSPGLPYEIWILSIVATILLVLISFVSFPHGEEGLASIMAWFTSGLAFTSAFNVDHITSYGVVASNLSYILIEKHTIYHFDMIAYVCLLPMLIFTVANSIRIWLNMKAMKEVARVEEE